MYSGPHMYLYLIRYTLVLMLFPGGSSFSCERESKCRKELIDGALLRIDYLVLMSAMTFNSYKEKKELRKEKRK